MRKTESLGYLLALVAFVLKLYRFPLHTYLILLAITYLLAQYIYWFATKKVDLDSFFIGLSSTFFLVWLLFLTKFFPFPAIPMALSATSLVLGIYFKFRNKSTLADGRQCINLILLIICIVVYKMPNDERYYLTGIRYNYHVESDYMTWAKYSWFLYRDGKYSQALIANEKALSIANQMRDEFWVNKIIDQQEKIKDRSWTVY